MFVICTLSPSDKIQLFGILISMLTGIIAIIISILSLRQNSKMIENTSRPYIGIYGAGVYVRSPNYYLTIRNFGNSSATITSFTYDFDLSKCTLKEQKVEPFQDIENSTLLPGQSYHCVIDINKSLKQTKEINFHVIYTSGNKTYEDEICLNLAALSGNYISHKNENGDPISVISETLQDIHINSL